MESRNLQPEFHELLLESSQTLEASDHFDLHDDPESARQFETLEANRKDAAIRLINFVLDYGVALKVQIGGDGAVVLDSNDTDAPDAPAP